MKAMETIDFLMEKTALSKVRALYEAGKLSEEAGRRLFYQNVNKNPINLIHARINAKANRLAGNAKTSKPMNRYRYERYERPDTLPKTKEILDSGRITRRAGHNNGKVLATAKKEGWLSPDVYDGKKINVHVNNGYSPGISSTINATWPENKSSMTRPFQVDGIEIGSAGTRGRYPDTVIDIFTHPETFSHMTWKELNALIARHEISGELHENIRMNNALETSKLPTHLSGRGFLKDFYRVGTHNGPGPIQGDHNMVRKMSLIPQIYTNELRNNAKTNFHNTQYNTGLYYNENQLKNIVSGRNMNEGLHSPMTKKERDRAIRNTHRASGIDPQYTDAFLNTKPILNTEY